MASSTASPGASQCSSHSLLLLPHPGIRFTWYQVRVLQGGPGRYVRSSGRSRSKRRPGRSPWSTCLAALAAAPSPRARPMQLNWTRMLPPTRRSTAGASRCCAGSVVVAHHLLQVVFLQVHRPPEAADQGAALLGWGAVGRERESAGALCHSSRRQE